jgi:hypothetical protein
LLAASIDVVFNGHAIEDEVEAASVFLDLVGVTGNDDFVRADAGFGEV